MMDTLVTALLWFCAIGCAVIGGLFFAFSTFIMTALGRIDRLAGIAAMNAINAVILRSLFMQVFFGTTLASLALAVIGVLRWGEPGALAMAAGGVIYVVGMFVVTMAFNVPLNNQLARAPSDETWARYLKDWTLWNHVRTIAPTIASALFICALIAAT
jgi:uncharacterized membrane protein